MRPLFNLQIWMLISMLEWIRIDFHLFERPRSFISSVRHFSIISTLLNNHLCCSMYRPILRPEIYVIQNIVNMFDADSSCEFDDAQSVISSASVFRCYSMRLFTTIERENNGTVHHLKMEMPFQQSIESACLRSGTVWRSVPSSHNPVHTRRNSLGSRRFGWNSTLVMLFRTIFTSI